MYAAPLLVSFSSINKYIEALPEKHKTEYLQEIQVLYARSLPPVVSVHNLAIMFGYSPNFVYTLSKCPNKFYRSFEILQGNKRRTIYSPKVALKVIQKWFGFHLSNVISFPLHVCGFVKGRSFIDAAKQHIGAKWILSFDIKDFFPSITIQAVTESLIHVGYSEQAAKLLAELCCLNKVLSQGSPASPILSNICMRLIDDELIKVAKKYNVIVTRYVDDIVFSGKNDFNNQLKTDIENLFNDSPFTLNSQKTYFADSAQGQRLKVHGLLVKESKITLTKGYRNKLRAYKYMLNSGRVSENDIARITGHVKFSEFIEVKSSSVGRMG